jgi:DNA-binding HxlR family transcriptional regulator
LRVRIADKWAAYAIHVLPQGSPLYFNELKRRVDGLSQRMLPVTRCWSERHRPMRHTMYPEGLARVEEERTDSGGSRR